MNQEKLAAQLHVDEARRARPYLDTEGNWTAGVGRNLSERPFSDDEIDLMLRNDIRAVERELDRVLPWWRQMSEARQNVLANMCFNLGISRLLKFVRALDFMRANRFDAAAQEMLDSKWARQVGARATRLAATMRKGEF